MRLTLWVGLVCFFLTTFVFASTQGRPKSPCETEILRTPHTRLESDSRFSLRNVWLFGQSPRPRLSEKSRREQKSPYTTTGATTNFQSSQGVLLLLRQSPPLLFSTHICISDDFCFDPFIRRNFVPSGLLHSFYTNLRFPAIFVLHQSSLSTNLRLRFFHSCSS